MKRASKTYTGTSVDIHQLLHWANEQRSFLYLNGNNYPALFGSFPHRLMVGNMTSISCSDDSLAKLEWLLEKGDWAYGYFSYDLKNELEALSSDNHKLIAVDHLCFMVPNTVIDLEEDQMQISTNNDPDDILRQILFTKPIQDGVKTPIPVPQATTTKDRYIHNVLRIKEAILEGQFYEMNYCMAFTANNPHFDPISCYQRLNSLSPMPFSVLLKQSGKYLVSASPERFLKKEGKRIISQPIKGTKRRSADEKDDKRQKKVLFESEKERTENLMIVDLVRNDLARSAKTGTVTVEELFGVHSFQNIHQMISTVTAEHDPNAKLTDIIRYAFPMGSMTGAPKIRVMEEIESLEDTARGLYSGAVGYFTPEGDFDFNVVIRSIIFEEKSGQIAIQVGSAITYDSDPEEEYRECMLKAETMLQVLMSC
jgi:para-aminobenzoate synthetase component 1